MIFTNAERQQSIIWMWSLVSNSQDQVVGTVTSQFRKGELKSTSMLIYEDTVLKKYDCVQYAACSLRHLSNFLYSVDDQDTDLFCK
jgi:hypothetical protein